MPSDGQPPAPEGRDRAIRSNVLAPLRAFHCYPWLMNSQSITP